MGKTNQFLETVDQIATDGINKGIFHLYTEDTVLEGNRITLKGKSVINFGSCSYLGLEFDERLKNAAKQAVDDYGTQFSESRAYVSTRHYQELETLLNRLFEAHCVVAPTTTLGHIATIPVVVGDTDAVIMDHQVHSSVQTAVQLLKARGVYVELLRHNRMDLLEERVRALRGKHAKIWYMADGVYSMYGDKSPMDDLYALLNKYTHLHLYVDDAHGMSIYGKHGRGHVLNNRAFHPKMVLGTSLNKAFAAGGGVMLFPTAPMAQKVRACGGPLITSGPMQPGALGAALASARIHLSPEIVDMQQDLQENIRFTQLMIKKHGLPLISESGSAVFFIGVSLPKLGYNLVKRMLNAGYYLNLGIFPAVPIKNTGVRFTITRLHTFAQIEAMIATMAAEFPKALAEEGLSLQQIYKAFKLPLPEELELDRAVRSVVAQSLELTVCHTRTIQSVDKKKWNDLFADKGNFDWDSLLMMERSFGDNELAEHNWKFDYLLVSDRAGLPVAATFLTTALYKDDVLAPAGVSRQIEQKRLIDPYYLTSTVIAAGSPVTEGEQFYIDKNNPLWQNAVQLIFEKIYLLQEQYKATSIMLRDFVGEDRAMDDFFVNNGFFKMALPDCYTAPTWNGGTTGFVKQLSANGKRHYKKYIERHADKFDLQIHTTASPADIEHWYNLYCNTQSNKLELNTFTIPPKFFANLMQCSGWEAITLTVKPMYDFEGIGKAVAVVFAKKTATQYIPLIIGMDYGYKDIYHTYRQALYQVMQRAHQLGCQQVRLGFSSGIEKSKIGGKPYATYAYAQVKDTFNMEAIAVMSAFATNNEKK